MSKETGNVLSEVLAIGLQANSTSAIMSWKPASDRLLLFGAQKCIMHPVWQASECMSDLKHDSRMTELSDEWQYEQAWVGRRMLV